MKRKIFAFGFWILLLLFGNAITSNVTNTSTHPGLVSSPNGSTTNNSSVRNTTSNTTVTPASSSELNTTRHENSTATSSGTTAAPSNVTSTSTSPTNVQKRDGKLKPGDIALIVLATIAMAGILLAVFLFYFKISPCPGNVFNTDLYHPHGCTVRSTVEMARPGVPPHH